MTMARILSIAYPTRTTLTWMSDRSWELSRSNKPKCRAIVSRAAVFDQNLYSTAVPSAVTLMEEMAAG